MSDHIHQPQTSVEHAWTECVTPVECTDFPDRAEAHGGTAFTETCECGAIRSIERGTHRVNVGNWVTPAQQTAVKEAGQLSPDIKETVKEAVQPAVAFDLSSVKSKDKKTQS